MIYYYYHYELVLVPDKFLQAIIFSSKAVATDRI